MTKNNQSILLIFGTSADPVHQGHVHLVTEAVRALQARGEQVAEIMLMPVFRHHNLQDMIKRSLPLTFEYRFGLCQLAAEEIKRGLQQPELKIGVSRLEESLALKTNRPNFTRDAGCLAKKRLIRGLKLAFRLALIALR